MAEYKTREDKIDYYVCTIVLQIRIAWVQQGQKMQFRDAWEKVGNDNVMVWVENRCASGKQ